jgi:protein-disulfide isomerase
MSSKSKDVTPSTSAYEEDVITIELQYLLTPIAIILGSLMISASIFFALKNYGGVGVADSDTAGDVAVADDTAEPESLEAIVSIDDDAVYGNLDTAKVAIVEFSDYQCPYCQKFWMDTLPSIKADFVDSGDVVFVYRDFPVVGGTDAAIAANCAREQGGDSVFYDYHDELFGATSLSASAFTNFAKNLGLNTDKFDTCMDSGKYEEEINNDASDATAAGLGSTPSFVIGVLDSDGNVDGIKVIGAQDYAVFKQVIEEQLEIAG